MIKTILNVVVTVILFIIFSPIILAGAIFQIAKTTFTNGMKLTKDLMEKL
jgi:hypothetical protein